MTLPRYATVIGDENNKVEDGDFFQAVSQLEVREPTSLHNFMVNYKNTKIKLVGVSDSLRFCKGEEDCPEFDPFSVDLWQQYYIQEGITQIAVLEDKQPVEGLFVGDNSGRVYICAQADDFSQQKVMCIASSFYALIWRGPQNPVEYNSGCLFDNCYGCFDPVLRHRMFRFKQF